MTRLKANPFGNRHFWNRNSHVIMIYTFTLAIMLTASVLDKDFLTGRNLNNLVLSSFPIMIASFGQMLIILTAGIDLSLGSVVSLCNVVCVALMPADKLGVWGAVIAALLTGALCGAVNGFLVTKLRLTPVIATIATMSIFAGLALMIQPIPGGKVSAEFSKILLGRYGFPTPIILMLVLIILVRVLTTDIPFGKKMRAIGGNEDAAYSSGIAINRTKVITYAAAGLLGSIAAIFLTAQMRAGDASVGDSYTMNSITVAVVGGTFLSGSVGNVLGAAAGAIMLMVLNNILNLIGVSSFYQFVFQGLVLIAALAISSLRSKK